MGGLKLCTERLDVELCKRGLGMSHDEIEKYWSNDDMKGEASNIEEQVKAFHRLCRQGASNGGLHDVSFKHSAKYPEWEGQGRLFAQGPSLQKLSRRLRGALAANTSIDIDAVNCYPTLLFYLCKQHNIRAYKLQEYVENRAETLSEVCEFVDMPTGAAKTELIRILHSSFKLNNKLAKCPFLVAFRDEISEIQKKLARLFPDIVKEIKEQSRENGNELGALVARLLQIEEGKMLTRVWTAASEKYIPRVPVFDGFMVDRLDQKGEAVDIDDLIALLDDTTKDIGIRWAVKPLDRSFYDRLNAVPDDQIIPHFYDETEEGLCRQIHESIKDRFFKADGVKYGRIGHVWTNNEHTITDEIRRIIGGIYGYVKKRQRDGSYSYDLITQRIQGKKLVAESVLEKFTEDPQRLEEIENRTLGKIAFKNGQYDFDKGKFIPIEEDPNFETFNLIPDNHVPLPLHHPDIQLVLDTLFFPMFGIFRDDSDHHVKGELPENDEELHFAAMEAMLHWMARDIAGVRSDKRWYELVGERNSSKGVWADAMKMAWGSYIGEFNSGDLKWCPRRDGSFALVLSFTLRNRHQRIVIAQEACGSILDGPIMKKLSSGGDIIIARVLFKNEVSFRLCTKYYLCANDIAKLSTADALQTRKQYVIRTAFVENPDPSDPNQQKHGIIYMRAIDGRKLKDEIICSERFKNGLRNLLMHYYRRTDTCFPEELLSEQNAEDVNENPVDAAKRLFEFVPGDESARISNARLKEIFDENRSCFDTADKMKKILVQCGAVRKKSGIRCLMCIREKGTGCQVPRTELENEIISAGPHPLHE